MSRHTFEIEDTEIREDNPWQVDTYLTIYDGDDKVGSLELNLLDNSEILNYDEASEFFEEDDYTWVLKALLRKLNIEGLNWNGEQWEYNE